MNSFAPLRVALVFLAVLLVGATAPAMAGPDSKTKTKVNTKILGTFQDWKAYSYEENGQKVCYMSSQPKKLEPKGKVRGDAYILVTHFPAEKNLNVISVTAGYTYKKGSEVVIKVDRQSFKLLIIDNDTAWARDEATDKAIAQALRGGKGLTIKGTSSRGTNTTDTYSLSGAGSAFSAINEACGIKK